MYLFGNWMADPKEKRKRNYTGPFNLLLLWALCDWRASASVGPGCPNIFFGNVEDKYLIISNVLQFILMMLSRSVIITI